MAGLSTEFVTARVSAMRGRLGGATITIRHDSKEYTGVRTSLSGDESIGSLGALQGATGAVRLVVSELSKDHPKSGDTISVKEQAGSDWQIRVILGARYDQTRATLRIDYGEQYG